MGVSCWIFPMWSGLISNYPTKSKAGAVWCFGIKSLVTDLIYFMTAWIKDKIQRIIQKMQNEWNQNMNEASDLVESKNLLCLWKGLLFCELVSAVGAAVTEDDTPQALKCCLSRLLKLRKIRLVPRIKHCMGSQGPSLHFPALIPFCPTVSGKSLNVCVYFPLCRFAGVLFHLIVVVVWFLGILTGAG